MLNAKLVVVGGEVKATEIKLKLPCIIGRGKGSTVMLPHPLVSRQHCELFESNGRLWVRDLGSLNGTYVNNEKVSETELPPNELLTVGTVTFRAMYEPLANVNPPVAIPQFLPSKAREEDDQPTVRVDLPIVPRPEPRFEEGAMEEAPGEEPPAEEMTDEETNDGMPSTPLFQADPAPAPKTVPKRSPSAPQLPPTTPPQPLAIPAAVAPNPAPEADPEVQAENAEEDEDFQDFLKNLGNK